MNTCNRLIPACYRLSKAAVPSRTFFGRRCLVPSNMIERQIEEIDRELGRMERNMNVAFREFGFPVPRVHAFFERPTGISSWMNKTYPAMETEVTPPAEQGKPGKYLIKVDIGEGFAPENFKINLKDGKLTFQAKLDHKSEDGSSSIYREFSKTFTLPEGIKEEEAKCVLTPEGVLTFEVPLHNWEKPQPKEIPISIEGNVTNK